jgi:hypothetical protein
MESLKIAHQTDGLGDSDRKLLYKVSGISAVILVISYIIIIVLYVSSGVPPTGGEEWLKHITGYTTEWWSILGLSVFTDLLYIPVAYSLYILLKVVNKNAILTGSGFLILFVFLDLAITWPNYSSLITLSSKYAAATSDAQRATIVAAANYASAVLSSSLIGVYVILVPAIGILIIGLVMLRGVFSKATAYLGVVTGILGVVSVGGTFFISALGIMAIPTSILTTVWFLFVGYRLLRLSQL